MKRILVCGDAMIDRYIWGDVERISPEAPVPVLLVHREEERQGAALNVLANIRAMGGEAEALVSESHRAGSCVIKQRVISRGQQVCRMDWDRVQVPVTVDDVMGAARNCDIVVLCDYGKGTLDLIGQIIWNLRRAMKTVLVDPKSRRFKHYAGATLLKPNLAELRLMIGGWDSEEELEHKVKALQRAAEIDGVLLTRGGAGMSLYAGSVSHYPAAAARGEVVDVCGAGDTSIAAFAVALARGLNVQSAARVANKAAGISVMRFGTVVVEEREVFQ